MNAETVQLAVQIADQAARDMVRKHLNQPPHAAGWYYGRPPSKLGPAQAQATRVALRYLHRRGLVWDHPQRPWVTLSCPLALAAPRRGARASA